MSTDVNLIFRFSPTRNSSLLPSKYFASSSSLAVSPSRNLSAGTETSDSFTFSLRRLVLLVHFLVGHGDPVRQREPELLEDDALTDVVLELLVGERRALHPQDVLVARFADELPVLLEDREADDPLAHLGVGRGDAQARGLGHRDLFIDQLLQDLPVDAQLFQHLGIHVAAVGVPVRLHLHVVDAREVGGRDHPVSDAGNGPSRRGVRDAGVSQLQEVRDVEHDEGQHHQSKTPFEPGLVAPHAVEHRHGREVPRGAARVRRIRNGTSAPSGAASGRPRGAWARAFRRWPRPMTGPPLAQSTPGPAAWASLRDPPVRSAPGASAPASRIVIGPGQFPDDADGAVAQLGVGGVQSTSGCSAPSRSGPSPAW